MSLEVKFENFLRKSAQTKKTNKNSEANISVFRVGFLEILEEDRRRKGERRARRRLHSIREPDDFIAAEGRQTLRRTRNTSGKSLKGFTNSRSMEILM